MTTDIYDDDETPDEQAIAGAELLIAAMRAGNCSNTAALIEPMRQHGTRDFRTFIGLCDAEEAHK